MKMVIILLSLLFFTSKIGFILISVGPGVSMKKKIRKKIMANERMKMDFMQSNANYLI